MSDLRTRVIKLAYEKPALRSILLPLVMKCAGRLGQALKTKYGGKLSTKAVRGPFGPEKITTWETTIEGDLSELVEIGKMITAAGFRHKKNIRVQGATSATAFMADPSATDIDIILAFYKPSGATRYRVWARGTGL